MSKWTDFELELHKIGYSHNIVVTKGTGYGYSRVVYRPIVNTNGYGYKTKYIDSTYARELSIHLGNMTDLREIKAYILGDQDNTFAQLRQINEHWDIMEPFCKAIADTEELMRRHSTKIEVMASSIHFDYDGYYTGVLHFNFTAKTIFIDVKVNATMILASSADILSVEKALETMKEIRRTILRVFPPVNSDMKFSVKGVM